MCELSKALDCENEEIVLQGFVSRYNVTTEEAKEIFTETKKLLWLATKTGRLRIDTPLLILDEMWHNFILHTKQYLQFCTGTLKTFVHHSPTHQKNQVEVDEKSAVIELEKQCNDIYNYLGPETLIKWYDTYANKYTPDYMKTIKK